MTGRELIKWIQDTHAEDKQVIVQYRDAGGTYYGGEVMEMPMLAYYHDDHGDGIDVYIEYSKLRKQNCMVL